MVFETEGLSLLQEALEAMGQGFQTLPEVGNALDSDGVRSILLSVAGRMQENYPYFHPLYVGQMLKPPHPVARLAYALAMFINPNNHALDGGRASSEMEKEAVAQIAAMFGWSSSLGHLTSGGTMANFEALWIARELAPGKAVAASAQAHYTHSRLSAVLGVPFRKIASDERGRMDIGDLREQLQTGEIGTVVATLGTTAAGTIDPLPEILELRNEFPFRLHVDSAYGGYFTLASNLGSHARAAYDAIANVDSIVIDPHKHGLQPYGCGCVLFREASVGRFYKHDSPYTYFTSEELHLGEISLECSRAGASAVALWATMKLLPLDRNGSFARSLEKCREGALQLHDQLQAGKRFVPLFQPELDILVWGVRAHTASESSRLAREVFTEAEKSQLYLALATFPRKMVEPAGVVSNWDREDLVCLRACVMKPEHLDWMPEILKRLEASL